MKNKFLKIGVPLMCAIPAIAGGGIAINAYVDDNIGWTTDLEWKPTIEPVQIDGYYNNDQAEQLYGQALIANPNIYLEDYYKYEVDAANKFYHDLVREWGGRENVKCSFKVRARNVKVRSEIFHDVRGDQTHYLVSGEFETRVRCNLHREIKEEKYSSSGYESYSHRYLLDSCEFSVAKDLNGNWSVKSRDMFLKGTPWKWSYTIDDSRDTHIVTQEEYGPSIEDSHYKTHAHRTNEEAWAPLTPTFTSNYFKNVKYLVPVTEGCDEESSGFIEYFDWPEMSLKETPEHQEFTVTLKYNENDLYKSFRITGVTIDTNPLVLGTDYTASVDTTNKIATVNVINPDKVVNRDRVIIGFTYDIHPEPKP